MHLLRSQPNIQSLLPATPPRCAILPSHPSSLLVTQPLPLALLLLLPPTSLPWKLRPPSSPLVTQPLPLALLLLLPPTSLPWKLRPPSPLSMIHRPLVLLLLQQPALLPWKPNFLLLLLHGPLRRGLPLWRLRALSVEGGAERATPSWGRWPWTGRGLPLSVFPSVAGVAGQVAVA